MQNIFGGFIANNVQIARQYGGGRKDYVSPALLLILSAGFIIWRMKLPRIRVALMGQASPRARDADIRRGSMQARLPAQP